MPWSPARRIDGEPHPARQSIATDVPTERVRQMRLHNKVAIIIGAGQNPGQTIGNGRATTLRFAQEGARILAVDRRLDSAEETARLARDAGADCVAFEADVTNEQTLKAVVHETR